MTTLLLKTGLGVFAGAAFSSCALQSGTTVSSTPRQEVVTTKAAPKKKLFAAKKAAPLKRDKHGMITYKDSERRRHVRTTSYSHMENEPGAPGRKNAIGTNLKYGKTIRSAAADWSVYPVGTHFKIKGNPYTYVVDDYGSALVGTNTVDIYKPTLRLMRKWGTRKVEITVTKWGSYERSRKILKGRTGYRHCRKMYNAINSKLNSGQYAKNEVTKSRAL